MMKRKYFSFFGVLLLAVLVYGDVRHLYKFLALSQFRAAYTYINHLVYIALPVAVFTGVLFLYTVFVKPKTKLDRVYISSWLVAIVFTVGLHFYFESKSNDLTIVVKNLSTAPISGVSVVARHVDSPVREVLGRGDSLVFSCKCREAGEVDSIGIRLVYRGEGSAKKIAVVSANQAVYRQTLSVLVVNDTLSFVNHDIPGQWVRLEGGSGAYTTNQVYAFAGR